MSADNGKLPVTQADFDRLLDEISKRVDGAAAGTKILVGVGGAPGSGKTTLAQLLAESLTKTRGIEAANLPMDGYHLYRKELDAMPNPAEAHERRGAEWTFDVKRILQDLQQLRKEGSLSGPTFDHAAKDPAPDAIQITASHRVVVMEGNYMTYTGTPAWAAVRAMFDIVAFVRCDLSVSTERLAARHVAAWGVSMEDAMARASGSDFLNAKLAASTESNADLIVDSVSW